MQSIERVIITAVLRDLRAAGYQPAAVYDDGDYVMSNAAGEIESFDFDSSPPNIVRPLTDDEVLEAIDSVSVSTLHFTHRNAATWGNRGVLIVLGNGRDVICDYHAPRDEPFPSLLDAIGERVERGAIP